MKFRIYKPAKSAMQSGRKNTQKWLLVPIEEENIRSVNPLMGWVSAKDTSSQIRFEFADKEEAIKFAENRNFEYEVEEPKSPTIKQKSYAANFTG
jgi:hypothetical protein